MTFNRFDSVVAWIEDIVSAFCLAVIVVIAAGSVFGRYVLHTGFLWADEVNQMLLVAMGMFGSARAVRSNGHAEFTSFINNRKSRAARISMQFTLGGTMKSTVLRIPRMYFYMSIPMGFGLCIYEYLKVVKIKILTDAASEKE